MELIFTTTSGPGGDQTYSYDVTFGGDQTKEYTVKEVFHHILADRNREWGCMRINRRSALNYHKTFLCDYKYGNVSNFNHILFNEYADSPVKAVKASGGYSAMDYVIFTEDEKLIEALVGKEELEDKLEMANDRIRGLTDMIHERDKKLAATPMLLFRMKWLVKFFKGFSLSLICFGILWFIFSGLLLDFALWKESVEFIGIGLLSLLGYQYCKLAVQEFNDHKANRSKERKKKEEE